VREELRLYLVSLINDIPQYVYVGLLTILCIGGTSVVVLKMKRAIRAVIWLLLTEYVFLIYSLTVFYRGIRKERVYDYTPFWSYEKPELVAENIMNVVVFLPIGLLLGCAIKSITWWKVLLVGSGLSVSIEMLQMVFKRGFSEVDDIIHNTLGCMIGYWIYSLLRVGYERLTERNMGVL